MTAVPKGYSDKLDPGQQAFLKTGHGRFFADNFLFMKAEHGYVIGPTGSGKTNKNYNLVNWLKYTEVILWISASKDDDIIPLLFMGLPVNLIIPKYADVDITAGGKRIENHPCKSFVNDPSDVIYAIKKDHINILEVRNAFWSRPALLDWMIEFFTIIADWTRRGTMPPILPPTGTRGQTKITVFLDESQWLIAGSKVTNDPKRAKTTEIIGENMLEIRTYGWRFVISSQGFTNIPPAIRDNMACKFLCNNAMVDDPPELRFHCKPNIPGWRGTASFKRNEWKFVSRNDKASPNDRPMPVPLYPKDEHDREQAKRMRVVYAKTYHDQPPASAEAELECTPDLGRYAALAIPPEEREKIMVSVFDAPRIENET